MELIKSLFWLVIIALIALAMMVLVPPMIAALQSVAQTSGTVALTEAEQYAQLRQAYMETRLLDPYDSRWWGKRLTGAEYGMLEKALNDFFTDTEMDGVAEQALYDALHQIGIEVAHNLEDAVHAANHLINKGKVPNGEPLPKSIQEDADEGVK